MPYCPRCGVEVDASVRACPLCSTAIPVFDDLGPGEPAWPAASDRHSSSDPAKTYVAPGEWRGRVFLAIAGVFLTAALTVLTVDLWVAGAITWSRYPLIALVAALAFVASNLLWRQPWKWGTAWFAISSALVASLDAADGTLTWAPGVGLPVVGLSFGLLALGAGLGLRARRRGYNLFALVFALVAVELVGIDSLVTAATAGSSTWGWSVVAALVLVPLSLIFLVLHLTIRRTPDLRRIFHF